MDRERFEEIFSAEHNWEEDKSRHRIFEGFKIIHKYIPHFEIEPAHDIIFSNSVDDIIDAGITEEDAKLLRDMNWGIDIEYDCLYHFT